MICPSLYSCLIQYFCLITFYIFQTSIYAVVMEGEHLGLHTRPKRPKDGEDERNGLDIIGEIEYRMLKTLIATIAKTSLLVILTQFVKLFNFLGIKRKAFASRNSSFNCSHKPFGRT